MAWAGLGLAGCETGGSFGNFFGSNNIFGSSGSTQLAEPVASAKPAEAQPALAKVTVAPIIGAPDGVAKQIQDEFSGAVERQRVSVSTAKDDRVDYILRGYLVAAKDKGGTKVSYIWDVTDQTGKRVNRITGEEVVSGHASKDPWAAITPTVAQSVSGKAAKQLRCLAADARRPGCRREQLEHRAAGRRRRKRNGGAARGGCQAEYGGASVEQHCDWQHRQGRASRRLGAGRDGRTG